MFNGEIQKMKLMRCHVKHHHFINLQKKTLTRERDHHITPDHLHIVWFRVTNNCAEKKFTYNTVLKWSFED